MFSRQLLVASMGAASAAFAAGCGGSGTPPPPAGGAGAPEAQAMVKASPAGHDIHSYARPDQARVRHMTLDWDVDFDRRVLSGSVLLHVERPAGGKDPLRLDTRDLRITGAEVGSEGAPLAETTWRLGGRDPILGSELTVDLPEGADRVRVAYETSPDASGLQWLEPSQTAGGARPFLYSQAQAIHARSFVPCQDSPAIRVTFDAALRVPGGLRGVMAARQNKEAAPGLFSYTMPHPIPTYLIALAAGDLSFGSVGPRTGVWTEPPVLPRARSEFADMEAMLTATEPRFGPYRWERYDVLVLPPSFPFGGMENPMLTFATPTILAGDKSLVALIAHELAHSWSGNLVTNATWSDFWLNEGFTTYLERRIMEEVFGRERAEMEWALGRRELEKELEGLADKPGDQVLHIDLSGRDPDDGVTSVAYDKGALFLRRLEETFGREAFDPFLKAWFDEHAFTSVRTADFLAFLQERLVSRHPAVAGAAVPDVETWVRAPGLPADAPLPRAGAFEQVDAAARAWAGGRTAARDLPTAGWVTHQWLRFLDALPAAIEPARMKELDDAFGFTRTGNAEILDQWLILAVRHGYKPADARLEEFLTSQGRRKYLKPLYEELVKSEEGRKRALAIYARGRPLYHSISRATIDKIVGWPEGQAAAAAP
ncbi:MAG TPA: M1 family metallopeptidase [Candidatus Polarisedimenticolia bacterium]|nr:M1 family metallopeptidase [Candidatus Polarisedimenticolia bacterium]